jgi:hypothetical protein
MYLDKIKSIIPSISLKSKKNQTVLAIIICACLYWINYRQFEYKKALIDKDGIVLHAVIKEVYTSTAAKKIVYDYYHYGKKYDGISKCPIKYYGCETTKSCIGDTIYIKMSTSNPDYTIILDNYIK